MEFRILNAYRDGDMKAHRREAKNTALIECVQVAAEKAKWPLGEQFKRMSSRKDGGGAARRDPADAARRGGAVARPRRSSAQPYDAPRRRPPSRPRPPPPALAAAGRPRRSHGATRFSSVFGRRR